MKIVLLESLGVPEQTLRKLAAPLEAAGHTIVAYEKDPDPQVLAQRLAGADAAILANMPLSGAVIRQADTLRFLDIAFTGVDHVDLEAAKERGICVSNAAGYSTQAVAELAVSLMLSLLRNVPQVEARCRTGGTKDGLVGQELGSQTVGLVGTGAIGLRTAALLRAFGCRVLAYAPRKKEAAEGLVEYVSLETLLEESDIVSLHCPLNNETRGMIGREELARMKPTAYLINTARGPVVDTAALAEALNAGRLAGAGLDVFEMEPPLPENHPLLNTPNTLVTPHVAFASRQSMTVRAEIVFDNLNAWLAGTPKNRVC